MSPSDPTNRSRMLAVGLSTLASTVIALIIWWVFGNEDEPPIIEFYADDDAAIEEMLEEVRAHESKDPLGRTPMPPELANKILSLGKQRNTFDDYGNYVNRPHWEGTRKFREHPDGEFKLITNSISLGRDTEVTPGEIDLRVLITGDSHLDGMCNNSENLCAIAETALEEEHPGETIEVLNAGRGGYHFWNYVGILEHHLRLDLTPDVFVVMFFGGNDFSGTCRMSHIFDGTLPKSHAPGTREKRLKALHDQPQIMGQGYNSVLYFRDNPEEAVYTLEQCKRLSAYIVQLCEENGIELLFLYLPAPLDLDWDPPYKNARTIRELLNITGKEKKLNDRIGARLLSDLKAASISAIDLTPALGVDPAKYFWKTDLHLSVSGHQVVGMILADALRDLRKG